MSYNGSGTFQINSSGQPVVTATTITSTAFNAFTADIGTGLSTAICKDGQTTTTARIPFAAGINSSLTTDASSTSTGSIITAGGIGCAKKLYVGTSAVIGTQIGVGTAPTALAMIHLANSATTGTSIFLENSDTGAKTWRLLSTGSTNAGGAGLLGFVNASDDATHNKVAITAAGSFIANATGSALATNATDGFTYVPSCAGTPTGVPTSYTGALAMVYDSTNDKLYVYRGGWKTTSTFT